MVHSIASCKPRLARFCLPIKPLICDVVYSNNIDFTPTLQIIETYYRFLYSRSILTCCLRSIFWASALRLSGLYSYRKTKTWTDLPNVRLGFYYSGRWLNYVQSREWTRSRWVPKVPSSIMKLRVSRPKSLGVTIRFPKTSSLSWLMTRWLQAFQYGLSSLLIFSSLATLPFSICAL